MDNSALFYFVSAVWMVGGVTTSAFEGFDPYALDLGSENWMGLDDFPLNAWRWQVTESSTATNGVIKIKNGASNWGGLDSGSGSSFIGLKKATVSIERTLYGLVPGQAYTITFLAAYRPDSGGTAKLTLFVDGKSMSGQIALNDIFEQYAYDFTATNGSAAIRFSNEGTLSGDRTAFLDALRVYPGKNIYR